MREREVGLHGLKWGLQGPFCSAPAPSLRHFPGKLPTLAVGVSISELRWPVPSCSSTRWPSSAFHGHPEGGCPSSQDGPQMSEGRTLHVPIRLGSWLTKAQVLP